MCLVGADYALYQGVTHHVFVAELSKSNSSDPEVHRTMLRKEMNVFKKAENSIVMSNKMQFSKSAPGSRCITTSSVMSIESGLRTSFDGTTIYRTEESCGNDIE